MQEQLHLRLGPLGCPADCTVTAAPAAGVPSLPCPNRDPGGLGCAARRATNRWCNLQRRRRLQTRQTLVQSTAREAGLVRFNLQCQLTVLTGRDPIVAHTTYGCCTTAPPPPPPPCWPRPPARPPAARPRPARPRPACPPAGPRPPVRPLPRPPAGPSAPSARPPARPPIRDGPRPSAAVRPPSRPPRPCRHIIRITGLNLAAVLAAELGG